MRIPPILQHRYALRVLAAIVIVYAAILILHWLPGRQVRLHQAHLLQAAGNRDWKKVLSMISPDYGDRWGHDRRTVLAYAPEAFSDFLVCDVQQTEVSQSWMEGAGIISARIRIAGSGGPIAQLMMAQCDNLKQPFKFKWQRESWEPWDWALVEIEQPEASLPQNLEL